MGDNGRGSIKLHQTEFIDIDPLSRNSRLTMEAFTVGKVVKSLFYG